jgi:tRNA modification GTPase
MASPLIGRLCASGKEETGRDQMIFGDTIVALSSGRLPSGVAVIRISGHQTRFVIETICEFVPDSRVASLQTLRRGKEILDRGLVLFFPMPHSFTGEDVAELQVHGGRATVSSILHEITSLPHVRLAEAGEFTRRAFMNGKLDLVQTEALADLINAETEAQRRLAQRNSDGAQSRLYAEWRNRLVNARALIEADIDFSDEGDVPGSVADRVWTDVAALSEQISEHIKGYSAAEIIQDGFHVVILGTPNAGKSSLLNALARRDAAIVTDEPGTTRDVLEVALDINGLKVIVADTAGIRDGAGKVESIGIEKARARGRDADLILKLEDLTDPHPVDTSWAAGEVIRIGTKLDLVSASYARPSDYDHCISTVTGEGMTSLVQTIGDIAEHKIRDAGDILPSRFRHVELLHDALSHIGNALRDAHAPLEIRAEELRLATDRLGRITGAVDVEELLGVIFSQFCIGK